MSPNASRACCIRINSSVLLWDATLCRRSPQSVLHRRAGDVRASLTFVPDWYQTSWHSREYILDRLSAGFGDVRYRAIPDGLQDVVVARKVGF